MTQTICWLVLFTALFPSFGQTLSITGNIFATNFMIGSIGVETTTASPTPTNRLTVAVLGFENKTGKPEEAIGFLQKSVEEDPTQGDIYKLLGQAYIEQGKFREARNNLRNALHNGLLEEDAEQARQAIAQINEKIGTD
jgi:tetratricopeptide (TPR) repeat protein